MTTLNKHTFSVCNSRNTREAFLVRVKELFEEHPYLYFEWYTGNPRTTPQNNALHVYFRLVAEALNDAGITFEQFFKPGFEVPWNDKIIKGQVWAPMQEHVLGFKETSKCKTTDYPKVYDALNQKFISYGLSIPWPERKK